MSASFMITILKNNENLLSKRKRFKNKQIGYNLNNKVEYNLPKASKKELNEIKKKLVEERKIRMLKVVLLTLILFLGLISIFLFSVDGIVELLTY